jgi:hypothetical protein
MQTASTETLDYTNAPPPIPVPAPPNSWTTGRPPAPPADRAAPPPGEGYQPHTVTPYDANDEKIQIIQHDVVIEEIEKEFKFKELPKDIQEQVIEKHRDINVNYDQWADFEIDEFKSKLEKMGYYDPHILYSGFSSQGDGASFSADVLIGNGKYIKKHLKKLIKAGINIFDLRTILKGIEEGNIYCRCQITQKDNHYYHHKTMNINLEMEDDPDGLESELSETLTRLENFILEEAQGEALKFYHQLERSYDSLTDDEAIIETIEANEYTFDEYGDIV